MKALDSIHLKSIVRLTVLLSLLLGMALLFTGHANAAEMTIAKADSDPNGLLKGALKLARSQSKAVAENKVDDDEAENDDSDAKVTATDLANDDATNDAVHPTKSLLQRAPASQNVDLVELHVDTKSSLKYSRLYKLRDLEGTCYIVVGSANQSISCVKN